MNSVNKTDKKILRTGALLLLLAFALFNLNLIGSGILKIVQMFAPFLIGGLIAMFISVPLKSVEKLLRKRVFKYKNKTGYRGVAILLTLLLVSLVVAFVFVAVIPQLYTAIVEFANQLPNVIEQGTRFLERLRTTDYEAVNEISDRLIDAANNLRIQVESDISTYLLGGVNIVTSTFSALVTGFLAFVFSIYLLFYKETFKDQVQRFLRAFLPTDLAESLILTGTRASTVFANFISATFIEAVIFGLMSFAGLTILGLPYRSTIAILEGFMAFIPYFGAFFGAFIGFILIASQSIKGGIAFLVMTLVIQQIETNLIYPRVVGNKVGLPGIWVMMSVAIGGSVFGLLGMVLAVPVMTLIYYTLGDIIEYRKLRKQEDPTLTQNPTQLHEVMRKHIYEKDKEVFEEETIFDKIKPKNKKLPKE